jgi:hypothetical protein
MDDDTQKEIDRAIFTLEQQGITPNNSGDMTGLGDVVEETLKRLGVTEERFKSWFNLDECNCDKRKQWLNKVFSWKLRRGK